jgi:anaerobic selenocysteine-containing dehydrogenase
VALNPADGEKLGVADGDHRHGAQQLRRITLAVKLDPTVKAGVGVDSGKSARRTGRGFVERQR